MKKLKAVFLIALGLLVTSCTTTKNQLKLHKVYVTNKKKLSLLPPANASEVVDALQVLNITYEDSTYSLLSYTQVDATGISLSLMNAFGADMGNLFYDGNQVSFESAYFPPEFLGEYIVEEIQNAYYDTEALKKNYASAKLDFSVLQNLQDAQGNNYENRAVLDGEVLIEDIKKTENKVIISNYIRGYYIELINAE